VVALYFFIAILTVYIAWKSTSSERYKVPGRLIFFIVLFYCLIIKPIPVALGIPSFEIVEALIIFPVELNDYWLASILLALFYLSASVAMYVTAKQFIKQKNGSRYDERRVVFRVGASNLFLLIGCFALIWFFATNSDILETGNKNSLATDDISQYRGDGILRTMIAILQIIPIFMMQNIAMNYRAKMSIRIGLISGILFLLFNYFSDQRGGIIFSIISWAIAYNIIIGNIKRKYFIAASLIALMMISLKTYNRLSSGDSSEAEIISIVANLVGRNYVENSKTIAIINAVDSKLGYDFGGSIADSIKILVPRSIYPEKTTVNLDTKIAREVFDCSTYGGCATPPGLIAEAYLNFGYTWVFISTVLSGALVAFFDWRALKSRFLYCLIYSINLFMFGAAIFGSGINSYITQTIVSLSIVLLMYVTLKMKFRNRD
jgi:oligosaccharide repeat unit polymerase